MVLSHTRTNWQAGWPLSNTLAKAKIRFSGFCVRMIALQTPQHASVPVPSVARYFRIRQLFGVQWENIDLATLVSDHELIRRIGGGAYGEVWLARTVVGTLRAAKLVRRDAHASADSFEREFKGLQEFEPISRAHEGLVDILTLGLLPDGAGFYYVMELADGVVAAGVSPAAEGGILPPGLRADGPAKSLRLTPIPPGGTPGSTAGEDAHRYTPRTLRADLELLHAGRSVKCRQAWQRSLSFGKRFALPIGSCAILLTAVYLSPWKSSAPHVKPSKNSAAKEAYDAGLIAMHTVSQESPAQAARYFERAVELDPQFAAAYAQLSLTYVLMDSSGGQMLPKARDRAARAVFLDPQLSEAHFALATVKLLFELDWSAAEKERQLALELNPRSEDTMVSSALILAQMGRWEEAVTMIEKALRIESRSVRRLRHAGNVFLWSRQYDRAIRKFEPLIAVSSPTIRGRLQRVNLANAYRGKGDYLKSIEQEREGALLQGENPDQVNARCDALKNAFQQRGPKGYWQARLEFENASSGAKSFMALAVAHAELGNVDAAFDSLERAFREIPTEFAFFIHITPSFDRLRSDKRWTELTNKLWCAK